MVLKAKNQMGTLILIFITIIIGITLVTALGNQIWENVNAYSVVNDQIEINSTRGVGVDSGKNEITDESTISLSNDNIVSLTSGAFDNGTTLTVNVDYNLTDADAGTVTLYNTTTFASVNTTNMTNWTYTHGDLYVTSATSRTILNNLILIFIITGLVIWVYAYVRRTWLDDIN